jgi:UDP-N-acetylmuramate dehydrogenase
VTLAADLLSALPAGQVRERVPIGQTTSLKTGGSADILVVAHTVQDVVAVQALTARAGESLFVLGAGSNLIVGDDGVRGVVLRVDGLASTEIDDGVAHIGAGTMNAHAVRAMHKQGWVGAEFLALVPGQFGGSVVMNAGTRWGELSDVLVAATVVDRHGGVREIAGSELAPRYRHGGVPAGCVVVGGTIRVQEGDTAAAGERIREEKRYRGQTQPYREPCFGSAFANPPGDAAGRLIEAAGLKGLRWGGAEISGKHANFIVNTGQARALDVVQLMALARRTVREQTGVVLRPEVRLCGFGTEGYCGDVGAFLDELPIPAQLLDAASAALEGLE